MLFGSWWGWLEQWGQWVSIGLGLYYAYALLRSAFIGLFSCRVLYQDGNGRESQAQFKHHLKLFKGDFVDSFTQGMHRMNAVHPSTRFFHM